MSNHDSREAESYAIDIANSHLSKSTIPDHFFET